MATRTVGFAVADEDLARLERLAQKYGGRNRSAFLREAMRQMEVLERAERLSGLQAYGAERSAAGGVSYEDAVKIVRRVLKGR
jgi:predicted transcriptional regulator